MERLVVTTPNENATQLLEVAINPERNNLPMLIMPDSGRIRMLADGLSVVTDSDLQKNKDYIVECYQKEIKPYSYTEFAFSNKSMDLYVFKTANYFPDVYHNPEMAPFRLIVDHLYTKGGRSNRYSFSWNTEPVALNIFRNDRWKYAREEGYQPDWARWDYVRKGFNGERVDFRLKEDQVSLTLSGENIHPDLKRWHDSLQQIFGSQSSTEAG